MSRTERQQVALGVALIDALTGHVAGCERCLWVVETGTRPDNLCPDGFAALRRLSDSTLSVVEVLEAVRAMENGN